MGFYGNITNVNKSTFQFDRVYPNKATMEQFCSNDDVYIGRYVLVDYNLDTLNLDGPNQTPEDIVNGANVIIGYDLKVKGPNDVNEVSAIYDNGSPVLYTGARPNTPLIKGGESLGGNRVIAGSYVLIVGTIHKTISVTPGSDPSAYVVEYGPTITENDTYTSMLKPVLYCCTNIENIEKPMFEEVSKTVAIDDVYRLNYQVDNDRYGAVGRGWDSTVWQKVYKDGNLSYIMIAELNSVVPTFDISVDAPTQTPLTPHWDTDTSNIYYKLHVQPQWGLRIKQKNPDNYTTETKKLPSDVSGTFYKDFYLDKVYGTPPKDNGSSLIINKSENVPLAIYFNKNGFNKNIESTLNADLDRQQITDAADRLNAKKDIVTIAPTGKSDRLYNYHDGAGYHQLGRAVDTYELSVLLPSIGTSISEMWNVVYGKGTSRDSKGRLLWDKTTGLFATEENNQVDPKNALRNTNILWNNINGTRLIYPNGNGSFTYNPESINNLVTGINTIHDLVGQIIIEVDPAKHLNEEYTLNHVEDWDPTKIYYIKNGNEGKFYIKEKDYTYQESNVIYKRATNVVNSLDGYYRQEIHEFPTFDDETLKSSENEEKETLSKKVYIDYKKASNDGKFIDGAIYYTIDDPNLNDAVKLILPDDIADSSQELYQKDGVNYNKVLNLESSDSKNGQFYKLTTTQIPTSQESPYEFYVPGRYYFATATTEDNLDEGIYSKIIQGNEETLNGAFVAAGQPQFYHIFRNITTIENTSGGFVEDIDSPIIRKNVPFPENSINYTEDLQRGKLILKTDEGETICEIPADRNESVDFENKTYSAYTYKVEPIIGQNPDPSALSWTLWEIYKNNYLVVEKNGNPVKAYNLKQGQSTITYSLTGSVKVPALRDFNDGNHKYYIKSEDNYILETWNSLKTYFGSGRQDGARNSLVNNKLNYYELVEQPIGVYYSVTDPYYYKDNYNNWLRETAFRINTNDVGAIYENNELVQKSRYFTINPTKIGNLKLFSDGVYYSDTNGTIATNYSNTLYEKVGRYVVSDDLNIYDIGAEWNEEIVPKPSTVKVGTRNIVWKAVELPELSENFNTLLGLILRINNKLLSEDTKTRDLNTVQGCINKINDILDKFHQLVPAEIAMVDAYGRVHSGDWDSKQKSGYSNIGKPNANVAVPAGDPVAADNERWLKLTTTSGASSNDYKPHIKLEHTFKSADDTNTTADKNVANSGDGLNKGNDDTLKLYTPIVDNMGHVIGKNTETVTLPYGFKTIATGAASNAVTNGNGNNAVVNLVADNTKDTLTINPSNKWVRIAGTANSDTFTIGHQVNDIDITDSTATNLNTGNTSVINIPDFTYDEAGHITSKKKHDYTLPYNFKTITVGDESNAETVLAHAGASIAADEVYDTLTFNEGNKWISLAADANGDGIKIGHAAGLVASTVGDNTDQSPSFGGTFQALQVGRDIAGHVTTLSAHNVELPTPSLNDSASGNVMIGMSLVPESGAFTSNKANVGTLALTGYNQITDSITNMPQATDSINTAISKLSFVLNNDKTTVDDRLNNLGNKNLASSGVSIMPAPGANTTQITRTFAQWAQLTEDLKYQLTDIYQSVSFAAWPIGSIYLAVDDIDPVTKFGVGTWMKIGEGQFLMSAGENFEVNSTGGSTKISVDQMPTHTHTAGKYDDSGIINQNVAAGNNYTAIVANGNTATTRITTNATGGGEDYYPPYIAVSMWKRTA